MVGDLDGDGFGDMLVGAPERVLAGQSVGAVDVFLGGAVPDARVDQSLAGPRTGGFFGGVLAWLPRSGGRR